MAVPKQRKGRMKTHSRRSANSRTPEPARSLCPECGSPRLPHHICPNCGSYKGREVIEVD